MIIGTTFSINNFATFQSHNCVFVFFLSREVKRLKGYLLKKGLQQKLLGQVVATLTFVVAKIVAVSQR